MKKKQSNNQRDCEGEPKISSTSTRELHLQNSHTPMETAAGVATHLGQVHLVPAAMALLAPRLKLFRPGTGSKNSAAPWLDA